MNTIKKQQIALVGLGMALDPHVKSLRDLAARVDITAAWAPSAARRAQAAQKHGLPVVDSLDAILDNPDIDVVLLLSPPHTHLELIRQCAVAKKHVLVEKPLDISVARALEAVELMEDAGLQLGVVFQHRYRAAALALRDMVQSGELGRLASGSASIRWWRTAEYYAEPGRGMKDRDGGGVLLTQAIHTLDLFLSLAGPIREVTAFAQNSGLRAMDTEDITAGAIRFENGAIGAIDATTLSYPGFPERIELACEKATAVLTGEVLDVYFQDGRHTRLGEPAPQHDSSDPMAFDHGAHQALILDFLDALRCGDKPSVDGRSALHVQRLIEALLDSAQQRRAIDIVSFS